jgi:hypothetical protein
MDQQDAVIAHLDRRMKQIGATALGMLALGLFAAMVVQDPDTVPVQNIVRTQRLELVNAAADLPVTAYYDNGRKWWKGTLVNGRLEGPWIRWDRSGAVMELGEYRDDVRFGTWRQYLRGFGTLYEEGPYRDGLRKGLWRRWQPTRNLEGRRLEVLE